MSFEPGTVWLVGAGPGDPGLLTLHAARALAEADVVLHDALVSPEILALAPQARLEPVGKRAGGRRTPQLRINERLIRLAREGNRVVRLKGGDPLVFGRGGEEALALAAAGIRFRIIPGISAGVGGAASAGIPVTHRGLARSVAFVTGHDASGELPDARLARPGARRGRAGALHGAAPDRRDRRASACGRPRRRGAGRLHHRGDHAAPAVAITTLAEAERVAATIPSHAPTLIVIGPVVALRPLLAACQDAAPPLEGERHAA